MDKQDFLPDIGIIALRSFEETAFKVDTALVKRYRKVLDGSGIDVPDTFLINANQVRFANGEGKVQLTNSVRGKDIFIFCDVGNFDCTYQMHGYTNRMGPDEHLQDLKRTLSAIGGKARRTTVIMPLLYSSRQDKRRGRESLDCAMALQELENMGIENIMTFDVHNSAVQNAIPLTSFENLYPTYNIVKTLKDDLVNKVNTKDLKVVSPDTGAMDRAIFYAQLLNADVGMFYKRRDYSTVKEGINPILQHIYLGSPLEGQNVLIVDDMIGSGGSVFNIIDELKKVNAASIFVATTFALFTDGIEKFNEYYDAGLIDKVYSTNLTYIPKATKKMPWFREVDMSSYLAKLIEILSYSRSLAPLLDEADVVYRLMD